MDTRDDFFSLIHKALRRELYAVAGQAAATDWTEELTVDAVVERWFQLEQLLHAHSDHEDRHFFALAERKAPGATTALSEQHVELDRALETIRTEIEAARRGDRGDLVHRRIAAFVGDYLPHLELEERYVMPLLWASCSDNELAATRADFMADMPPAIAEFSVRLMLPAVTPPERAALLARIRATAPAALEPTLATAAEVLTPAAHARLLADLAA